MDLSIVIPALDEGRKIRRDVEAAAEFLARHHLRGEILIVDDGSTDDTARAAADAAVPPEIQRRVIHYTPHRGKGYAVRTGMKASCGQCVMFADAGLCTPFDNALRGMELIQRGECEIAHGSRRLPESVVTRRQPLRRRFLARLFRLGARLFLGVPGHLTDTQCGFKIYRGDVSRALYGECVSDGFLFDIEVLLRALKKGYRVREFPIHWQCDPDSRLHPVRNAWKTAAELAAIRRRVKNP